MGHKENNILYHVSIIILNWNNWQDTVECMESVLKSDYANYSVVLIDNNSDNNSVKEIIKWFINGNIILSERKELVYPLLKKPIEYSEFSLKELIQNKNVKINTKCVFAVSDENLGFAKGVNQGIRIAQKYFKSKYFYILNNDTVVHPSALCELVSSLENDTKPGISQSTIYEYNNPFIIANAGGKVFFWGQTKYFKNIESGSLKNISFINGCAFLLSEDIIKKYGYLSEKFFFGEEDFELSLRMKKNNVKLIAVADSKVYHKIGHSKKYSPDRYRFLFIHGLNRIISMKDFYHPFFWRIWKLFMLVYYFFSLILRHQFRLSQSLELINNLLKYSSSISDVKKNTLENIFSNRIIWKNNLQA